MEFTTTITKKGQVVIPKKIRDALNLSPSSKLSVSLSDDKNSVNIKPVEDILDLAGKFGNGKAYDAVKLREKFEKNYERF